MRPDEFRQAFFISQGVLKPKCEAWGSLYKIVGEDTILPNKMHVVLEMTQCVLKCCSAT